ncbi:hypothetical protein [Desulfocucumis palustris]|nr:hypothetical protein [Desulfocucumis palustris]
MAVLASSKTVPLGRMLFVEKQGYSRERLVIEASGPYSITENEQCFVIRNEDCCKAIVVTVRADGGEN